MFLASVSGASKPQNFSKQKKNRKSPGPGDFDNSASSRAEDVQSPAYSDISDDSTPVVDSEIGEYIFRIFKDEDAKTLGFEQKGIFF
jgi:hypothetical protein